jgi:nucleoside-diphosphate-sugar epimerase
VGVLVETSRAREIYTKLGADVFPGSVYRLSDLEHGLLRADVAIFFGTDMPATLLPSLSDLQPYDRTRRDGTRNFVAACVRQRVPLLVLVSSVVAYGHCREKLVAEDTPLNPPPPAQSFADMEEIVRQGSEFQGLRRIILRAGIVYSAHAWHTRSLFSILARGRLPPLAGEEGYVSPIHTADLAEAVALTAEKAPAGTTLNVVDDQPVRLRDLLREAARAMGVRPPGALPSFLLRLYMGKDLYRLLQTSCRACNARAKQLLGWKPRFPSVLDRLAGEVALWRETYVERIDGGEKPGMGPFPPPPATRPSAEEKRVSGETREPSSAPEHHHGPA